MTCGYEVMKIKWWLQSNDFELVATNYRILSDEYQVINIG